jgi:hypothetical protein
MCGIFRAVRKLITAPDCPVTRVDVNYGLTKSGEGQLMAYKQIPKATLAAATRQATLDRLAATGIYRFKGSGGEQITIVNKEKLRNTTSRIVSKGNK